MRDLLAQVRDEYLRDWLVQQVEVSAHNQEAGRTFFLDQQLATTTRRVFLEENARTDFMNAVNLLFSDRFTPQVQQQILFPFISLQRCCGCCGYVSRHVGLLDNLEHVAMFSSRWGSLQGTSRQCLGSSRVSRDDEHSQSTNEAALAVGVAEASFGNNDVNEQEYSESSAGSGSQGHDSANTGQN
jgi:hypothetical protein